MEKNFIDPKTREEFYFSSFRMVQNPEGGFIYKKKNGPELLNPANGNTLEPIPRPEDKDFELPFLMKSNNKAERSKMLQKRSQDHFKKEISEVKYQRNVDLIKNFKD